MKDSAHPARRAARLRIASLVLVLAVTSASARATPPGILVGNSFLESFEDGFDQPSAVVASANLEFVPGRARLLAGGLLAYDFLYDPIETPFGTAELVQGNFSVEIWDDLHPGSTWSVELTAGPDEGSPYAPQISIRVVAQDQQLLIESNSEIGLRSTTVARTPGWTRFAIMGEFAPWVPVLDREDESFVLETLVGTIRTWPLHPTRLEIRGQGIDVDAVRLYTYTYVANEAASWGRIKAQY